MAQRVLVFLVVLALFAQGCGTIIHGTRQSISISSTPAGAAATVDGLKVRTPATVSLSRTKDYVVTVEQAGYESGQAPITRSFNPRFTI